MVLYATLTFEEPVTLALTPIPLRSGPPPQVMKSLKDLNTSSEAVWAVVDATELKPAAFPVWVDIRDIAMLHVLATTEEVAKGQRYLCVAGHYDDTQIAGESRNLSHLASWATADWYPRPDIIIRNFPEQAHRIPKAPVTAGPEHFKTNTSKVEKELGIKWIDFQTSIVDTLRILFDLELEKSTKA